MASAGARSDNNLLPAGRQRACHWWRHCLPLAMARVSPLLRLLLNTLSRATLEYSLEYSLLDFLMPTHPGPMGHTVAPRALKVSPPRRVRKSPKGYGGLVKLCGPQTCTSDSAIRWADNFDSAIRWVDGFDSAIRWADKFDSVWHRIRVIRQTD